MDEDTAVAEAFERGKDEGATFVLHALEQALGVSVDYDAATETWDGDILSVLRRILRTSGVMHEETDELAMDRAERAESELAGEQAISAGLQKLLLETQVINGKLTSKLAGLREALEPFARIGAALPAGRTPTGPDLNSFGMQVGALTTEDFRRAALANTADRGQEEKGNGSLR